MSVKEFYIYVRNEKIKAFVYDNFLEARSAVSPLHRHEYAEVHFTEQGNCLLVIENGEFASSAGSVTVIPAGVSHQLKNVDSSTFHMAFLIAYPVSAVIQTKVPVAFIKELGEQIRSYGVHRDFGRISPYLAFLCKDIGDFKNELHAVTNRAFLLHEFFATRYNEDVTLGDLARELNLSEKQASRLVEKHMGVGFAAALTAFRINAAKRLMELSSGLTLTEIAYMVGYKSYSGFWKAYRKLK